MKNLMFLFATIVISASVMAQAQNTNTNAAKPAATTQPQTKVQPQVKDYVLMKGGKVWAYKEGKMTEVKADFAIGGTKVGPDGKVTLKDGKTDMLKDGDRVENNGTIKRALATEVKKETPKEAPKAAPEKK